jgi:paraquat-inducible protein B
MSQQTNPRVIGGFVLGALILVIAAILFFSGGRYFERTTELVTYFPGTVQGLSIGARVEFQGVQIGEVTDIQLNYWRNEKRFAIPVYYEIWPERLHLFGEDATTELTHEERLQQYEGLVKEAGLRARLESVSLVTGQYMIALGLYPDTEYELAGAPSGRLEIPAIEATRDRLGNMLSGLRLEDLVNSAIEALDAVRTLAKDEAWSAALKDADVAIKKLTGLLDALENSVGPIRTDLETTLENFSQLAVSARGDITGVSEKVQSASARVEQLAADIDKHVDPIGNSARRALNSVNSLIEEDSQPRYNLNLLLEEAAGAARSLRMLADYLEQNPDALLKGKYR